MIIKDLKTSEYFETVDGTFICELFHPERENREIKMNCSLAHATLRPGESSHPHRLIKSAEVYFILEGKGLMHIGDEEAVLEPGQAVYIPPMEIQFIKNISDVVLKFLCVVSPPWSEDDDEICLE
ncbi:MAG: cupin domain-containing protein [Methanobacteriaceae archaeon]|nr:cupin domain-containing protein [Methanobacteriaceae archaeon]MDZ4170645.1 cupin domain-containing protein [Methanobacteriaceae archaeon]